MIDALSVIVEAIRNVARLSLAAAGLGLLTTFRHPIISFAVSFFALGVVEWIGEFSRAEMLSGPIPVFLAFLFIWMLACAGHHGVEAEEVKEAKRAKRAPEPRRSAVILKIVPKDPS